MKVTLFDYGAGNLHSLGKAITLAGDIELTIETDLHRAIDTELFVLPGVGAFGPAAARLRPALQEVRQALQSGLPCLGICLGMQLLFDSSEEGAGEGLGIFPGPVTRLNARRLPHIGWSKVEGPALPLTIAYYANSFACRPNDSAIVRAWSTHEQDRFPAVVRQGRILGLQFHPEKSSRPGLALLKHFIDEVRS